jgi:sugar O-acyltransferase (sialic acid O-acetyltransferase NeuD family)
MVNNKIFLFGYSGHAYVVCDILLAGGYHLAGYFTEHPVEKNPYDLVYCGFEKDPQALAILDIHSYFVAVGSNSIRKKISEIILELSGKLPCNALSKSSVLSSKIQMGNGVMTGPACVINSGSFIGNGVICNSGSIIEHECIIGNYVHVAPGAILCGNVTVGDNTFIGAGSVIREGIKIGENVTIGAGTVVIKDIADGQTIVGNPQRILP